MAPANRKLVLMQQPSQRIVWVRMEEVQKILIGPPGIRQPIGTYRHR
jgi:hypothetical protein